MEIIAVQIEEEFNSGTLILLLFGHGKINSSGQVTGLGQCSVFSRHFCESRNHVFK
jgi:hypothetical protein